TLVPYTTLFRSSRPAASPPKSGAKSTKRADGPCDGSHCRKCPYVPESAHGVGGLSDMKQNLLVLLAVFGVTLVTATAHAQYGTQRDYEITMDVDDEPGKVADERYDVPEKYQRRVVFYRTNEPVGTIIVETRERMLYLVLPDNRAMRYGIGVGRDGFRWKG